MHQWSRTHQNDSSHRGARHSSVDVTRDIDAAVVQELPEKLHGVVYAPGSINLAAFRSLKVETFIQDYQVNLLGAVRVLQQVQDRLFAAAGSSVVMMSTVAVAQGMQFHTSVAAAKGAVEGFARSLAAEWAPRGVRVNVVAPSLTDTPLAARLLNSEKKAAAAAARHPLGRVGTAEDQARAVCFLLDRKNSWITGQVLPVDGGLAALSGF